MNKGLNKGKKMSFFAEYAIALFFYMYKTHIKYKIIFVAVSC